MQKAKPSPAITQALIDLYLNVKVRNSEDIENYSEENLEEERGSLKDTDPLIIIDYIKSSIEILLSLKQEDEQQTAQKKPVNESIVSEKDVQLDYEQQIQKLEAETRTHIRVKFLIAKMLE